MRALRVPVVTQLRCSREPKVRNLVSGGRTGTLSRRMDSGTAETSPMELEKFVTAQLCVVRRAVRISTLMAIDGLLS